MEEAKRVGKLTPAVRRGQDPRDDRARAALLVPKAAAAEAQEQADGHEEGPTDVREADRRSQVGTGERSEKIRTYNYPQNRVTDHRIGLSNYNLPAVMDGGIDEFIEELSTRDEADRLAASGVDNQD